MAFRRNSFIKEQGLRDWDKEVDTKPSMAYSVKFMAGDPDKPLPSWLKMEKKAFLQEMARRGGLSTEGTKQALLDRIRSDKPWMILRIDGRECIQCLLASALDYWKYDDSHLFKVQMPARGSCKAGVATWEEDDKYFDLVDFIGMGRPREQLERMAARNGIPISTLDEIIADPTGTSSTRELAGAAFDPYMQVGGGAGGGWHSLEELCLQKGDKLSFCYDFGDDVEIVAVIQGVQVLPVGHEIPDNGRCRAQKLSQGGAKMQPQYPGQEPESESEEEEQQLTAALPFYPPAKQAKHGDA